MTLLYYAFITLMLFFRFHIAIVLAKAEEAALLTDEAILRHAIG
jgi:hypothetical protein